MTSIDTTRERIADIMRDNMASEYENELRAAASGILAEFIAIPRSSLPTVEEHGMGVGIGSKRFGPGDSVTRWEYALDNLALALHLEAKEVAVQAAVVAAKRAARRDELVAELFNGPGFFYSTIQPGARKAIDRIIELEDQAAA